MQKLVHLLITCLWRWLHRFLHRQQEKCYRRKRMQKPYRHCPRKPAWVVDEVIRIHQETGFGSRKVTATFNGLHKAKVGVSVGKSFVAEQIRAHRYQALQLSKQYRHRRPLPSPRNHTWGVDMTGAEDIHGTSHTIVGMIDAGSRMALAMHTIRQRSALALLEAIIAAAKVHGLPCIIKTDNEACFTSRIFRFGLMCLGIRHQRSRPGSPWQNGRIERLFGTLKEKLDRLTVYHGLGLNQALDEFRFWYNCIRPHQHLDGWTPWEAWHGINPSTHAPKSVMRFIAWDGLLRGYHVRR
ncbi:transposase family protein [Dyella flagellata]|nr:integrase core domain-containing protein [Dyella flagellata]